MADDRPGGAAEAAGSDPDPDGFRSFEGYSISHAELRHGETTLVCLLQAMVGMTTRLSSTSDPRAGARAAVRTARVVGSKQRISEQERFRFLDVKGLYPIVFFFWYGRVSSHALLPTLT